MRVFAGMINIEIVPNLVICIHTQLEVYLMTTSLTFLYCVLSFKKFQRCNTPVCRNVNLIWQCKTKLAMSELTFRLAQVNLWCFTLNHERPQQPLPYLMRWNTLKLVRPSNNTWKWKFLCWSLILQLNKNSTCLFQTDGIDELTTVISTLTECGNKIEQLVNIHMSKEPVIRFWLVLTCFVILSNTLMGPMISEVKTIDANGSLSGGNGASRTGETAWTVCCGKRASRRTAPSPERFRELFFQSK